MAAKKPRKIKCPYCEFKAEREKLITHVIDEHEEMIPEGYTARRVIFNYINHKEHGNCVICKKPTEWIEEAGHYDRYCSKKCREIARKNYMENVWAVRGTTNLLNDEEHQKKMLAGRRISGTYRFKDGGVRSYTGSYEKRLLEFADKCLNIHSDHIMTPGPTLLYSFEGNDHKWIIDQFWVPWNLLIEVKDGGAHPNTKHMPDTRLKQVCKEVMITDLGTYNYLRLTDNQFPQLIEILMEIKKENMDAESDHKAIIKIYEDAHIVPPIKDPRDQHGVFMIQSDFQYAEGEETFYLRKPFKDPRLQHGVFMIAYSLSSYIDDESIEGFAIAPELIPKKILVVKNNKITVESASFLDNRKITVYKYLGNKTIRDIITTEDVGDYYFYEALAGKKMYMTEQVALDYENFVEYDPNIFKSMNESYNATLIHEFKTVNETRFYFPMMTEETVNKEHILTCGYDGICICEDINGFFVYNTILDQRSKSFESIDEISEDLVRQIYCTDMRRVPYYACTEFSPFTLSE